MTIIRLNGNFKSKFTLAVICIGYYLPHKRDINFEFLKELAKNKKKVYFWLFQLNLPFLLIAVEDIGSAVYLSTKIWGVQIIRCVEANQE